MPTPDDPTIDADRAAQLIGGSFPQMQPISVRPLGLGWDCSVHLVNARWVFRFPRNREAARALAVESELMPWLAPFLPLAAPVPRWRGTMPDSEHSCFLGAPFIEGRTICDAGADAATRARLAPKLGQFVRALHAVDASTSPIPLPADPFRRFDVPYRLPRTRALLRQWREEWPGGIADRLLRRWEDLPAQPPRGPLVPVHADLHARNILIDDQGTLNGVIDWIDLHAGHAALDLAAAFVVVPPAGRASFFDAYGPVDGDTIAWARWRAIDYTAHAFAGALARGDGGFARASRDALAEMADD